MVPLEGTQDLAALFHVSLIFSQLNCELKHKKVNLYINVYMVTLFVIVPSWNKTKCPSPGKRIK